MKNFHYFRMLRIEDWIKSSFWSSIIGAFLVNALWADIFLIGIIYFCATAYGFAINNFFDVEIDKKHRGKIKSNKNPLAQNLVTKRGSIILLGILLLIPVILSICLSITGFIFLLLSIFSSTLYSVKYIRLKERPGLDIISYGFGFCFFPFLAGVSLSGGVLIFPIIIVGILLMILSFQGLLFHQIVDYYDDLDNTSNLTLRIGREKSFILVFFLILISLLFFELVFSFFSIQYYFHFLIILFLIFSFPIRLINQFYKEKIKNTLIERLLLPDVIYENKIRVYQKKIKRIFFE